MSSRQSKQTKLKKAKVGSVEIPASNIAKNGGIDAQEPEQEQSETLVELSRENADDDKFLKLLIEFRVIRDSIHGDIWLTEAENEIIDLPIFQRLRKIKQLGPSYLVYPGALHTRFEHCIGAMFVAQKIIESVFKNYNKNYSTSLFLHNLTNEEVFLSRLIALIHDVAHVSWGHTLENEGKILANHQWKDEVRRENILEAIKPVIDKFLTKVGLDRKIETIHNEIRDILIAIESDEEAIHKLNRPFIADIVGNTICADLLDYLKRDAIYTGLKMVYDERIFSYFVIWDYKMKIGKEYVTKRRLALHLQKKGGKLRLDMINTCVDLLRMRYFLAQKVYHHRVKRAFSAVVFKMVYCAKQCEVINDDDLFWLGDDPLIYKIHTVRLKKDSNEYTKAAKKLATSLLERKKYGEIFSFLPRDKPDWEKIKRFDNPEERFTIENQIERFFSLEPGAVIIYPAQDLHSKVPKVKILREEGIIESLEDLAKNREFVSSIGAELDVLDNNFLPLQSFLVLMEKSSIEQKHIDIGTYEAVCQSLCITGKISPLMIDLKMKALGLDCEHCLDIKTQIIQEYTEVRTSPDEPGQRGDPEKYIVNSLKRLLQPD